MTTLVFVRYGETVDKLMHKLLSVVLVFMFLFFAPQISAQQPSEAQDQVKVYFFWESVCPHCEREGEFLAGLAARDPEIVVHKFELNEPGNAALLQEISEEFDLEFGSVPVTFIGSEYMIGYESDETTGKEIVELVNLLKERGDPDEVGKIIFKSELGASPVVSIAPTQVTPLREHPIDRFQRTVTSELVLGGMLVLILTFYIYAKLKRN